MTANEQDPDVIKWGLNLLDFDSLFNSSYGCDYNQDDGNTYHGRYMRDYNYNTECNSDCNYVENDAMIAHTLQEEFSRLAVGDAAQSSHVEAEHFHSSNVSSDWRAPPSPNYCPGKIFIIWFRLFVFSRLFMCIIVKLQYTGIPMRRQMIEDTLAHALALERDRMMVKIILMLWNSQMSRHLMENWAKDWTKWFLCQ